MVQVPASIAEFLRGRRFAVAGRGRERVAVGDARHARARATARDEREHGDRRDEECRLAPVHKGQGRTFLPNGKGPLAGGPSKAAGQGFEPQLPDPESGVLPLDDPATAPEL